VPPLDYPKKKWAVVLCALEGSSGDPAVADQFSRLFRISAHRRLFQTSVDLYEFTVADFWHDQTFGVVDVSDSPVYGWYPCGWTMIGDTRLPPFPGIDGNWPDKKEREVYKQQARLVLEDALSRQTSVGGLLVEMSPTVWMARLARCRGRKAIGISVLGVGLWFGSV
jgi:hypothetical protein